MVRVGGEIEMVDGDVASLTKEFEGDGSSNSRGTTGYGGGFVEEEVGLDGGGWGGHFGDVGIVSLSLPLSV